MNQGPAAGSANNAAGDSDRPVLRVEDLTVYYDTPDGSVKAAEGVSFSLKPGERLALVGESGSGKTTVATALMRLTRPPGRIVRGSVYIGDQDVVAMEEQEVRGMRLSEIALIPQGGDELPKPRASRRQPDSGWDHGAPGESLNRKSTSRSRDY